MRGDAHSAWSSAEPMILGVGRSTTSRNAAATLHFHKRKNALSQDDIEAADRANMVKIDIEGEGAKFFAKLYMEVAKTFSIIGPKRDSKPEAINDGVELGKVFVAEGATGARRTAKALELRKWTPKEISNADEEQLEGFMVGVQPTSLSQKLLPPGEGWVRNDDNSVINPQSGIVFVQLGPRAGSFLKLNAATKSLEDAGEPHPPAEYKHSLSAASSSWVRRGAKLDRAVILSDITKIARLALKFPLSFVDLPACAYALFQGHRSSDSAQWCAENFHKKLLPTIGEKIHTYETWELEKVLQRTLEALDSELLKSQHAFSGVSAIVALALGERVVVAGVGHVRAVILPEKGAPRDLLKCTGSLDDPTELERVQEARGVVRDGLLYRDVEGLDDAQRILAAKHVFDVLQIEAGGPSDKQQVRSAYRKLALRVHPDKQADSSKHGIYKAAFARLDSAKDSLEAMITEDAESCKEVFRILRHEVHTRAGAAALLGVDASAQLDTNPVAEDSEKACKALIKKIERMRQVCPDYDKAAGTCNEAVATMRRGCTAESLPRQEALLKEGVRTTRAMGARDLRWPHAILEMKTDAANFTVQKSGRCRLALLCGATASLSNEQLLQSTGRLWRQPKATALRWCQESDPSAPSSSAVCVVVEGEKSTDPPPPKRAKTAGAGPEGTVRVRHILFRHGQLRAPDPMARRDGAVKTAQEAEAKALETLEKILQDPNQFLKLCRELSDCQTATNPGLLAGDLGWLARGQQEAGFEDVAFSLSPNMVGDIVSSSRGVHLIQRLA